MQEWNFALAIGANLMKEENYENLRFELVCLFVCLSEGLENNGKKPPTSKCSFEL
jgi:hypothetical protein